MTLILLILADQEILSKRKALTEVSPAELSHDGLWSVLLPAREGRIRVVHRIAICKREEGRESGMLA